ncbi:MAG: pyridoxamine 5'-phosphate oxidase [Bacteroidota bacterium]
MNISELRKDYRLKELLEKDINPNPIEQFNQWFDEALNAQITEPNAMCLSTVHNNKPSNRIVLLKEVKDNGFVFFTNYKSDKGKAIDQNPNVALNFVWLELERQVRIEGVATKVSAEESIAYFNSRPLGSRLGAIVSNQSEMITGREVLENRLKKLEVQYADATPEKPEYWGGYIVQPTMIEFWQGRSNRLHDRLVYNHVNGSWTISRLSP